LAAGVAALAGAASVALAQNPADDSFLPVVVERPDTISITTNSDPDILPGLRSLPPERFTDDCIDLKEPHATEAKAIAKYAKAVARKGDPRQGSELQIKLAGDRTIRFFDYPCGENFASYIFIDLLPQTGFALVQQNVYEDYYFLAISLSTGRVSKMFDKPVLSPDSKRFATYRYDQLNGVTELTLYAVRPDRVVTEAACEVIIANNENGAALPKWANAESLSFILHDTGKPFPDGPTLKRQGKDWVLEGPVTFKLDGREKKPFRQVCKGLK
jgi:hypothetical protein